MSIAPNIPNSIHDGWSPEPEVDKQEYNIPIWDTGIEWKVDWEPTGSYMERMEQNFKEEGFRSRVQDCKCNLPECNKYIDGDDRDKMPFAIFIGQRMLRTGFPELPDYMIVIFCSVECRTMFRLKGQI